MSTALDHLVKLARGHPEVVTESVHTVAGVRDDGLVNLLVGTRADAVIPGVPALASYAGRRAGDKVTVRKGRGSWLIIGKAGAEPATGQTVTVSSGDGAPDGAGWVQAKTVYARGDEVYIARDTTTQPDEPAPADVTITQTDSGGWAEGHRNFGDTPRQGTYSGYGPWSGGWFYGTKIAQACQGRTVQSMTVRLTRSGEPHGYYSAQQPSIWTHDYATAPDGNLALSNRQNPTRGLGLGEGFDYPLTSSQVSALASGSMRGVGVYTAEYRQDYIIFQRPAPITITFSA